MFFDQLKNGYFFDQLKNGFLYCTNYKKKIFSSYRLYKLQILNSGFPEKQTLLIAVAWTSIKSRLWNTATENDKKVFKKNNRFNTQFLIDSRNLHWIFLLKKSKFLKALRSFSSFPFSIILVLKYSSNVEK